MDNLAEKSYNALMRQKLIAQIHRLLIKKHKTIAVAESCTGGLLAKLLTDMPGSSRYFIFGAVTYSNKTKETVLKIPHQLIARLGAVSGEVALRMSRAVRKISGADFGIGITGIAGPTGGTRKKPVGTVFIAVDARRKHILREFHFKGSRARIRAQAAKAGLKLLKSLVS